MFDRDKEAPKGAKSAYRYKADDTLRRWRDELRAEVKDLKVLLEEAEEDDRAAFRAAGGTGSVPRGRVWLDLFYRRLKLTGQTARITGILRDRWAE